MGGGWFGWLVNLVNWAKITISDPIALKFSMEVPNGLRFKKSDLKLFQLKELVGRVVGQFG